MYKGIEDIKNFSDSLPTLRCLLVDRFTHVDLSIAVNFELRTQLSRDDARSEEHLRRAKLEARKKIVEYFYGDIIEELLRINHEAYDLDERYRGELLDIVKKLEFREWIVCGVDNE